MGKVKRIVAAWVLVVVGFALMGAMGYIAHAESGPGTWFGGADGQMGNAPRKRPSGNRAWSGNEPYGEDDDSEVPPERDSRKPIPEDESVWEDVPESELTNTERLKSRPGNVAVFGTLDEFFAGLGQVEFEFREFTFPFWQDVVSVRSQEDGEEERTVMTEVFDSRERFNEQFDEMEKSFRKRGRKQHNPWRTRNTFIEHIEVLDFAPEASSLENAESFGMNERLTKTFGEVRKVHTEQCCVVRISVRFEELTSEETNEDELILCLVRKANGWKICWIGQKE